MNIEEIVKKINRSKNDYFNVTSFVQNALSKNYYDYNFDDELMQEKFKCYYLISWYCTDSWVGYRFYFFEDEFICYSFQPGRKYQEEYKFVSKELYNKVLKYISTFKIAEIEDGVEIINPDTSFDEYYSLDWAGSMIPYHHKFAYKKDTKEKIEIDSTVHFSNDILESKVYDVDGNIHHLKDLLFHINIVD